jgi:hypothetical protein
LDAENCSDLVPGRRIEIIRLARPSLGTVYIS